VASQGSPYRPSQGAQFALERGSGPDRRSTRFGPFSRNHRHDRRRDNADVRKQPCSHWCPGPQLYGWNWDYASAELGRVRTGAQSSYGDALQRSDGHILVGVWFATLQLDGVEVPVLLAIRTPRLVRPSSRDRVADIEPDRPWRDDSRPAAQTHWRRSSKCVTRRVFPPRPIHLLIVGVATLPAIGIAEALHTSMAIGAIVPADNGSLTKQLGPEAYPGCNGPNMVFLRVHGGVDSAGGFAAAQRLATSANAVLSTEPQDSSCGGQPGVGALSAAPGADHELPQYGDHAGPASGRTRLRSGGRSRTSAHRVGAASTSPTSPC